MVVVAAAVSADGTVKVEGATGGYVLAMSQNGQDEVYIMFDND